VKAAHVGNVTIAIRRDAYSHAIEAIRMDAAARIAEPVFAARQRALPPR
jgi:hypothetical protein